MSLPKLPRDKVNDYTTEIASARRKTIEDNTACELQHIAHYSIPAEKLPGNIEGFIGVAQVPLGIAGPMLVNGEDAIGEFYVPMATTEGTLVASYGRGMALTRAAGGIKTTVMDDAMQRAPVFEFESAREARDFGVWITQNFDKIKEMAEMTTKSGKLRNIEQYFASKIVWLRFNMTTGDAAGQNLVSKAVYFACHWILAQKPKGLEYFSLSGNMDTDKKYSTINSLNTRGKRVIAEVTIPSGLLDKMMHCTAESLSKLESLGNLGAMLAGSSNNGLHFANAITAISIACGQDVANVAESSAGLLHTELLPNGDFYVSVTIPSLIVATYGGGTALPSQKECLDILGCYGTGKVNKFAEIVAATVLCGELSLGSAIASNQWVSSHDAFGRNRE